MARTTFSGPVDSTNGFEINNVAITASAAELNAAADVSTRLVSVPDAASYSLLAANSGKTHAMPNLTASCTVSLPTPAAGLEYKFIYSGVAADAQNILLDSGSDTNYFIGGLHHSDLDGNSQAAVAGDGDSNSILTIVTPAPGTEVSLICDGTLWILSGTVASATVPSFANQA